ncbi:hypothetical protein CVT26_012326 [Gymnopilus dilepis]|uniref:Uncharacterized protein n=1 Tax=Gymnopilus dilepis TaxID=231916 RepID=A0A409YCE4_9AGAR|nr:hypothetical protein CVT26_012326 [Gymnopilus dilepis]
MAVPELFTDKDGRVPAFRDREIDGITWATLGGDIANLPTYITGRPVPQDDATDPEGSKAFRGRLRSMREVHLPDWYEPLFHWRAFWPTDPMNTGELQKLFLDDSEVPSDPAYGPDTITPRPDVKGVYKDLYHRLNRVVEDGGLRVIPTMPRHLSPPSNPWDLDKPFRSMAAMQEAASEVKLLLLEAMSWARWLQAVLPKVHRHKDFVTSEDELLRLCLLDLPSRGVVVNLSKDWKEVNIRLWLEAGVPVYYPWRLEERVNPRFAKLSPILLSTYTSEEHVALDAVDPKGNWEVVARQTNEYDDFFQLKDPEYVSFYETFEVGPTTDFYIINFEGWSRRPLYLSLEISTYRNALHFMIDSDGFDNAVTFWRWRPRNLALALELPSRFDDLHDSRRPTGVIRELWKDSCAPRTGQTFDLDTGILLNPFSHSETRRLSGGAQSFRVAGEPDRPDSEFDPRQYTRWTRGDHQRASSEDTMELSSEEDDAPTLLRRLTPVGNNPWATPPADSRKPSPPNAPVRRGVRSEVPLASRLPAVAARPSSPILRSDTMAVMTYQGLPSTIQKVLQEEAGPMTYPFSVMHLTEQGNWNFLLLDYGVLILPDEKAERPASPGH